MSGVFDLSHHTHSFLLKSSMLGGVKIGPIIKQ